MAAHLTDRFARYPEPLRRMLALGSCGRNHLLECAALGYASGGGNPETREAGIQMLLSAWGESPISGDFADMLLTLPHLAQALDEPTRSLLRLVRRQWRRPERMEDYLGLASQRRFDELACYLKEQTIKEPDNLYWYEQALTLGLFEGDYQTATSLLNQYPIDALGPCLASVRCQSALLSGDHAAALRLADGLDHTFSPGFAHSLRARAHDLAGNADAASEHLARALETSPWRASQAMVLSEQVMARRGTAPQTAPLPGSLAILLYSWNKADDLAATLEALLASDLATATGGAHILVLNNGSTDHTPEVLKRFTNQAGGLLTRLDLPVNIGAPAARNWLMSLEEVGRRDFCLYLDDDALVPPDWLAKLGAAVDRFPEAGVWGCKVADARQPALIQAADYHFHPAPPEREGDGPDLARLEPNPIRLSNLHVQTLDLGQFDYCRPCASVTGCCHLFRTQTLCGLGGFSLNLSPSQYDDLEHDLRLNAQGGFAVYQGGLTVAHAKRTGRAGLTTPRAEAGTLGNRYKLQAMHPAEEIRAACERDLTRTLADLEARYQLLDQARKAEQP